MQGDPMDAVEMLNSMKNLASGAWTFYKQLLEEGFEKADALKLACARVAGLAGGKVT